jgi:hypothetical protein
MSKMWNCVYSYGGLYTDQKIFKNREDAEKWFDTIVDGNDYELNEDCGYLIKADDSMAYYDGDERHPVEISCVLVEVE